MGVYYITFHSQPVVHACVWCWHYSGPNLPLRLRDVSCTPFVCADAVSCQRCVPIRSQEIIMYKDPQPRPIGERRPLHTDVGRSFSRCHNFRVVLHPAQSFFVYACIVLHIVQPVPPVKLWLNVVQSVDVLNVLPMVHDIAFYPVELKPVVSTLRKAGWWVGCHACILFKDFIFFGCMPCIALKEC
jgi:hypothetical protein